MPTVCKHHSSIDKSYCIQFISPPVLDSLCPVPTAPVQASSLPTWTLTPTSSPASQTLVHPQHASRGIFLHLPLPCSQSSCASPVPLDKVPDPQPGIWESLFLCSFLWASSKGEGDTPTNFPHSRRVPGSHITGPSHELLLLPETLPIRLCPPGHQV